MMSTNLLVRGSLFIAIAVVIQSIRLVVPLPSAVIVFVIGTGVNSVLALLVWNSRLSFAIGACFLLPFIAFLQGQGASVPFFIPLIGIGNSMYVLLAKRFADSKWVFVLPPVAKSSFIFVCLIFTLKLLGLSGKMIEVYTFLMSWPQLLTGSLGIFLARNINLRLKVLDKN